MIIRKLIIATLFLGGCASVKTTAISAPSGNPGYILSCKNSTACYTEAGKLCPSGYSLVSASEGNTSYVPIGDMLVAAKSQNLVIECSAN